jgi:hypothetical protein
LARLLKRSFSRDLLERASNYIERGEGKERSAERKA